MSKWTGMKKQQKKVTESDKSKNLDGRKKRKSAP